MNSEDPRIIVKETLKSELDFYNKCFADDACESLVKFREFIQGYYGERPNPDPKDKNPCIAIENLTYGVDQKGCSDFSPFFGFRLQIRNKHCHCQMPAKIK